MVLMDLSAAFNTVDHNILINILKEHYGLRKGLCTGLKNM